MNVKAFHKSVQGASHIKKNKNCQDASASYADEKCALAVVADGHGGDDYLRSEIGAKLACRAAEVGIRELIENVDGNTFFQSPEKRMRQLAASVIGKWNEGIHRHYENKPFTDEETEVLSEKAKRKYLEEGRFESAYGTTLLAVGMNENYWIGMHIGDGKCVGVNPEGQFKHPIPWDEKCFLNATTSICDTDAINEFRFFYSSKLPAAVFVASDGVDDCFKDNEQLHNLYKTILFSFGSADFDYAVEELYDYLPRLSAKGSGDDVSIAAILNMDIIPNLSIVKEFDKPKAPVQEDEMISTDSQKEELSQAAVETLPLVDNNHAEDMDTLSSADVNSTNVATSVLLPEETPCGQEEPVELKGEENSQDLNPSTENSAVNSVCEIDGDET